jgi:ribosomal protein S18 acetylase RimI-like enzyme
MIQILGVDNIFFEVADLKLAIEFYTQLGFKIKFMKDHYKARLRKTLRPMLKTWANQRKDLKKLNLNKRNDECVKNQGFNQR